jgi:ABC-type bacteriocin/lantibiotic exporter with double-glycine peptidase domain
MTDKRRRRFFAPEVVQTSAMDCGPASLKCLLEGFRVHASYGRLREACQTDVDGASIDTIEEVACQLGLAADQVMVPVDHVLVPAASLLPAMVVVRLPSGLTHFVVAWRHHGPLVQIMDPAGGRRWPSCGRFLEDLYVHETMVPATAWREWAAGADALATLAAGLVSNGIARAAVDRVVERAAIDRHWRPLAAVDAVGRMTGSLVRSGGIRRGAEATRLFERMYARTLEESPDVDPFVPRHYWSAWPSVTDGGEQVLFRGAVLITVQGLNSEASSQVTSGIAPDSRTHEPRSPELTAALEERPARAWSTVLQLVHRDGLLSPCLLIGALALAAAGVVAEALLFRSFFDIGADLALSGQRIVAILVLVALSGALLLIEFPIAASALRLGRRLEARLRIALLDKIPRLGDRYFRSRPASDMAERSHSIHQIRLLPDIAAQFSRAFFELLFTGAAIAWLDPPSAPIAALSTAVAVTLPMLVQPILWERDLRVRTHAGALGRFYLDALLGLVAVRTHGAESVMRSEHEGLLVEWARAGFRLQRAVVSVEGLQLIAGFGLAALLLLNRLHRGGEPGAVLLLAYWTLNLPVLGQELARAAWQYPAQRNAMLRVIEPLGALDDASSHTGGSTVRHERPSAADATRAFGKGMAIVFDGVSVRAAGHTILHDIQLAVPSGTHVAVVGASGAGKSSLLGLLLGWHRPSAGCVLVDDQPLEGAALDRTRRETAWVDPTGQLWNRTLLENLEYGAEGRATTSIGAAIDAADLREVLARLPDGLQTRLGEGGGSISGGEGQRVRLARALRRPDVRLVLLDEPFRGLERGRRSSLLERARRAWCDATLLCITHDVSETLAFDRVLVVKDGHIVEDGRPAALAMQADSHYRAMLDAEQTIRGDLWSAWRELTLKEGRLSDRWAEVVT